MQRVKPQADFIKQGIRFECQGTGKCCISRGSYGFVYMTLEDRRRMAKHLGMRTSAFTRKHCTQTDGHFHLKEVGPECQFLEGTQCGIYEGRPIQCRTWPFWPENMNARTWKNSIAKFCAGVGKGRIHTREEILKKLKLMS